MHDTLVEVPQGCGGYFRLPCLSAERIRVSQKADTGFELSRWLIYYLYDQYTRSDSKQKDAYFET